MIRTPSLAALAVADPALDMANPLKGPFRALALEWEEQARAALDLARVAARVAEISMADPASSPKAVSTGCSSGAPSMASGQP